MGKFDTDYDRAMYELTLDGADDETGSVQENGVWYGLLRNERAIVSEDAQGFVSVDTFDTDEALAARWTEIESEVAAWHAGEGDGLGESDTPDDEYSPMFPPV